MYSLIKRRKPLQTQVGVFEYKIVVPVKIYFLVDFPFTHYVWKRYGQTTTVKTGNKWVTVHFKNKIAGADFALIANSVLVKKTTS